MTVKETLLERCNGQCELCESKAGELVVYAVPPYTEGADQSILICERCHDQISGAKPMEPNHWRALNNTMWNTDPAVQVMVWRILNSLRDEGWTHDLMDQLYIDDETLAWARQGQEELAAADTVVHKDSNGTLLQSGDNVVLIKDLDVKGGGFTAKRGTVVKAISLVENNAEQIEGRINGQQIVILTKFVKKA